MQELPKVCLEIELSDCSRKYLWLSILSIYHNSITASYDICFIL